MQVFVLERVIPPLVITFKLAVNSVSSNHIFALFLFLFNSHYLKKVSIDPVQNLSIQVRKYPWTWSMTGGPWNRSKVGVQGLLVHVLSFGSKAITGSSFKFKLSHRSFAYWQTDLCEFGENFGGGSAIERVHEWRPAKNFPPIHTSGMSLSSQANRSSDRLDM